MLMEMVLGKSARLMVLPGAGSVKVYTNQLEHDPSDINRAREIASNTQVVPVGILYRNPEVPCYEDLIGSDKLRTADVTRAGLNAELDKHTVWPRESHA